jgi:prevent-host-death family protein
MKQTVSVADAKKHLSDILGRVAYGKETITITKRGKPMAEIIPIRKEEKPRHIADVVGKIIAQPDFTKIMEKVVADRKKQKPRLLKI